MTPARPGMLVLGIAGVIVAAPAFAQTPAAQNDGAVIAIAARRGDQRIELRVVARGAALPGLSEPFRAGERSRLFLTFADAKLNLAEPPMLDSAGPLFAGVDIAERDGGVRIALDVTMLEGYGLDAAGDTTIFWLTQPAPLAPVHAASESVAPAAGPGDLALARESARAGWNAFRNDVAAAASATAGFASRTATAAGGTAHDIWLATTRAASWLGTTIPFAGIGRALVLIALLGAPPLLALRFLRRRNAERPRAAEIVGLQQHEAPIRREKPKRPPKAPKQPKAQNEGKASRLVVTRTTADARLWAARTLADSGADVAEIARQTGLSREAAILLVRKAQTR